MVASGTVVVVASVVLVEVVVVAVINVEEERDLDGLEVLPRIAVEIGEATLLELRDTLRDHAPQVTDPFFTGQALRLADDLEIDLLPFVIEGIREGGGGDELEEPAVLRRDLRDLRSHA